MQRQKNQYWCKPPYLSTPSIPSITADKLSDDVVTVLVVLVVGSNWDLTRCLDSTWHASWANHHLIVISFPYTDVQTGAHASDGTYFVCVTTTHCELNP